MEVRNPAAFSGSRWLGEVGWRGASARHAQGGDLHFRVGDPP